MGNSNAKPGERRRDKFKKKVFNQNIDVESHATPGANNSTTRCIRVTGGGVQRANGLYFPDGYKNSKKKWRHIQNPTYCILWDDGYWWISHERDCTEDFYMCETNSSQPPLTKRWEVSKNNDWSFGEFPIPILTAENLPNEQLQAKQIEIKSKMYAGPPINNNQFQPQIYQQQNYHPGHQQANYQQQQQHQNQYVQPNYQQQQQQPNYQQQQQPNFPPPPSGSNQFSSAPPLPLHIAQPGNQFGRHHQVEGSANHQVEGEPHGLPSYNEAIHTSNQNEGTSGTGTGSRP